MSSPPQGVQGIVVTSDNNIFVLFHEIHKSFLITGIGALYNGLGPTVARTFPATAALFLAYEATKRLLHDLM